MIKTIQWSGPNRWTYFFYTEDGCQEMSYAEYLGDYPNTGEMSPLMLKLRDRVNNEILLLGRTIIAYNKRWLAGNKSQRDMFNALKKEQEDNPLQFFCPNGPQQLAFLNKENNYSISGIIAPNRAGKAQPVDTKIPTPDGSKAIGKITVGDYVFSEDGTQTKVIGVYPQGEREICRVEFGDGTSTLCDYEHLWKYLSHSRAFLHKENKKHKNSTFNQYQVLSTRQIINIQGEHSSAQNRGYIPLCNPVEFDAKRNKIHSRLIGLLLGDGHLPKGGCVTLTTADKEIADDWKYYIEFYCGTVRKYNKYDYRATGVKYLRDELNRLGMIGKKSYEKFIPKEYLYGSVQSRIDLLRGIMDSDGTVSKRGIGCTFTSTSYQLAKDVAFIVRSLGGEAKIHGPKIKSYTHNGIKKNGRSSWNVSVETSFCPFVLKRKASIWKPNWQRKCKSIYSIVPAGKAECVCIEVEHPSKTYLTNDFIVTHNTTIAWIDMLLDIVPCDPNWRIFTHHGVKWRPYAPPSDGFVTAVASYELVNLMSTIWPQVIKKWTPRKYLCEYASYGGGIPKTINWKQSPKIQTQWLNIWLMYYSMNQTPFESQAVDRFMWDEQGEEPKFDGADERLRTRNGRHVFSLTPHKVEGRPDTGAGSWIHDLDLGHMKKGHNVKFFRCSLLDDVPDWVYPENQKIAAYNKWIIEPEKNGDRKTKKEGESRLFGHWHETGGLVYDEWDRSIHLVDPFDIPPDWTRYRSIDWGRVNPTACLFGAVSPSGDLYIYDMYYKAGALVSEIAQAVIEKSGNQRRVVGIMRDEKTGQNYERWEEVQRTKFYKTVLDSRSYQVRNPNGVLTIGRMFANEGLLVRPACGSDTYLTVPVVKEWLNPNWEMIHPHTGKPGKPKVFIFRTLSLFIQHIEHYVNVDVTRKKDNTTYAAERPRQKDDHDMDAFRYMIMENPRYIFGFNSLDKDDDGGVNEKTKQNVDKYTGY